PFKPDREHLHHIFQRMGLSPKQTLVAICGIATLYAAFGIYGELSGIPEAFMFYAFIACFIVYSLLLSYVWRITTFLREKFSSSSKATVNSN
ncbi:UDP-N-acetylglucosamine--undecaprenyl-phosphate N-acetylglucosaminephosphotransferase, partial [Vibrio diabolicus]